VTSPIIVAMSLLKNNYPPVIYEIYKLCFFFSQVSHRNSGELQDAIQDDKTCTCATWQVAEGEDWALESLDFVQQLVLHPTAGHLIAICYGKIIYTWEVNGYFNGIFYGKTEHKCEVNGYLSKNGGY